MIIKEFIKGYIYNLLKMMALNFAVLYYTVSKGVELWL